MQTVTNQQKLKPWMGFVLFAVLMAVFLFVCVPMQTADSILGLVGTELLFLVMAILYGLIFKIPLKEMFPIKKFTAKDLFGSFFLVIGGSFFGLISVGVVGALFPSTVEAGDVEGLFDIITGGPGFLLLIVIIALLPAICEEAIHRGAILCNFRTIKKDWVIVLIMALFFGINHLSFLRFINTAILGAVLSYIVVKKNNMILSSIMHFTVNASATTLSYVSSKMMSSQAGSQITGSDVASMMGGNVMMTALPAYFMLGVAAPFFVVLGLMLLNPAGHKKIRFLFAGIIAVLCFGLSIGISMFNTTANKVMQAQFSYRVTAENEESPAIDLDIKEDGNYTFVCVLMNAKGEYFIKITDESGNVVSQNAVPDGGALRTYTSVMPLEAGSYQVTVVSGRHTVGDMPSFQMQVNKN